MRKLLRKPQIEIRNSDPIRKIYNKKIVWVVFKINLVSVGFYWWLNGSRNGRNLCIKIYGIDVEKS